MPTDHRAELKNIRTFPSLVRYLRDQMGWPIDTGDFEALTFEYTPEELGIAAASAASIQEIKRLRPLSTKQPWGIFFVKFEPKRLPVVALRRILSRVVLKKRASANSAERAAWQMDDLLFVSNYGQQDDRRISLAYFTQESEMGDLPTLRVLGWDGDDTNLHLDHVAQELRTKLRWPEDETDAAAWRTAWASAFTLRNREVITTSKRLAERLAEVARAIRRKATEALAIESSTGPLRRLMAGFKEALIHDLTEDDFADMYAQTIAYGLLSARVSRPAGLVADNMADLVPVTNPFLKELLETFLRLGGRRRTEQSDTGIDFDELGINEVVQLLRDANMEAVLRDFGDKNPQEDPVIHFYELFLKEYDAKKRMQRGVFYTPRPVVSYIVRSVHELLQSKFGLADGLADTATWGEMVERHEGLTIPAGAKSSDRFVTILDPATGTGTFLVEAIDVIHRTLVDKWSCEGHGEKKFLEFWNAYVPRHLLPRLHGYELLMAPYAIAHLKIGLKLHETGYRFESDERARIYLTNALEPASDSGKQMGFKEWMPALAHEAEAVNAVKRYQRFTLVMGNPPYAGVSANMSAHAQGLVDAYKVVDGKPLGERKHWLQDDYVKFIRLAQTTIAASAVGIVGYITNHGYVDNPTFRGMRHSLLSSFGQLLVLDLHGNAKKKERTPDGAEDENVFDIQQGVAILLAGRWRHGAKQTAVFHADLWGSRGGKYESLSGSRASNTEWHEVVPTPPEYFFLPSNTDNRSEYEECWPLPSIMPVNVTGVVTSRDEFVIDYSDAAICARMEGFLDSTRTDEEVKREFSLSENYAWRVGDARKQLRSDGNWRAQFEPYHYRPFDVRRIIYNGAVVWRRRDEVMRHILGGRNLGLIVGRSGAVIGDADWNIVEFTRYITDFNIFRRGGGQIHPLFLMPGTTRLSFVEAFNKPQANLNPAFLKVLWKGMGVSPTHNGGLPAGFSVEDIFHYFAAILYSPAYRRRYAAFLMRDFPRIPLAGSPGLFQVLASLGSDLVALHVLEEGVQQAISARYVKADRSWRYEVAKEQRLPITLSFSGPEKPAVGKVGWSDDTVWIDAVKPKKGTTDTEVTGTVGFCGVPEDVWNFHIGGYQVCEKWLKDRKGRTLTVDDIAHYYRIVIALHETIRLMGEIDEAIDEHGGWPEAFAVANRS